MFDLQSPRHISTLRGSSVAADVGEGRLTERIAGVQPACREPLVDAPQPPFAIPPGSAPLGGQPTFRSGVIFRAQRSTQKTVRNTGLVSKMAPEPMSLCDPTAGRSSPIRVRNNRGSAALARYRSPGGNVLQRRVRPTRPFPNALNGGIGRIGKLGAQHDQRPADHRCSRADRVANADDPAAASDLDLSALLSVLVRHNALENDGLRAGVGTDLVDLV
jgi:hypothetical protein